MFSVNQFLALSPTQLKSGDEKMTEFPALGIPGFAARLQILNNVDCIAIVVYLLAWNLTAILLAGIIIALLWDTVD